MTPTTTRVLLGLTTLMLSIAGATGARAEPEERFGKARQMVISADRLFGYSHGAATTSAGGMDSTTNSNSVAVFGSPYSGLASSFSSPRLALDGFVADGFSIGGAVSYFWVSSKSATATTTTSLDGFSIAPRVGFAAPLSPSVAIWPRAGFTYLHLSGSGNTVSIYALTLEIPFVFELGPHVALLAGPTVDLGVGGSEERAGASISAKETDIGAQFGLAGHF